MSKTLKYAIIALITLIGLLAVAAGIIAATFNPNDYKPLVIKLVQEKKQRTLAIPGEIKLTFFPRIGADLGRVSISEHGASGEFASLDSAKVSLELIPLLSRQLVVDRIMIDGLSIAIKRFKDGSTNLDDFLSRDESGQQIKFDVDSVSITNARVVFEDERESRRIELAKLDLETGRIANGAASKLAFSADVKAKNPEIDAKAALKTGFTIDLDSKHYVLKNADVELKGKLAGFTELAVTLAGDADLRPDEKRFVLADIKLSASGKNGAQAIDAKFEVPTLAITDTRVEGGKLNGQVRLIEGARTVAVDFKAASFEGSPRAFEVASMTADAVIKEDKLNAKASMSGKLAGDIDKLLFTSPQLKLALSGKQGDTTIDGGLTTPFKANMKTKLAELPAIVAAFTLPNPAGGALKLSAAGRASLDLGKQTMSAAFKGKLDESTFDAKLGLSKFSPAAYTFDIGMDRLDVDRYRSKPTAAPKTSAATSAAKPQAPEKPLDLSTLRDLRASGTLRIGALKAENIKTSNVRLDVRAAGGKLDIDPLSANLYGGTAAGSMSVIAGNIPRFVVRQNLAGVNVGPLLKDAIGKDPIEGRGNVRLDVTTEGRTFPEMKKRLDGTARLELRDGAVHGVNVAQAVRSAQAKIGALRGAEAPQTGTGSGTEKTDFSELTGSFRIVNGVAHNDDLNIKSPLIRVGGSGDVNLADERVDYLVKATVVSNLQGQGGPDLQALKGLTIPVRLSGPFSAISWKVDVEGLASELAKQKLGEKKEEVRSKAQEALDKEKGKVQDRIKEQFKGLFGK
jgi:AsmA protein